MTDRGSASRTRRPLGALAATVLVVIAVGGVTAATSTAGAAEVSPASARAAVTRAVIDSYPGLESGNVACPTGVRRARGVTFRCTVQLPGSFLVVIATQRDGSGTVDLEATQAVITKGELEQFVAANASVPTTVDCGPAPLLVRRPGQDARCTATFPDGARTVHLTVQDLAGQVTITDVT